MGAQKEMCEGCPHEADADEYRVLRQSFDVRQAAFHIDPRLPGILDMLGHNMTQPQVARVMKLSQQTVSRLVMLIRQKMNPDKA